ncbi:hypothetical protein [Pseudooceanicola aestuarii]|uniref:hypothetical protein n=1 Tax=Pseudooceanicola aestuarii TaxID=2697319 RepID=UPI0013D0EBA8|nr:hypothetical protein [Pseudooceanicola aestuarii]
MMTGTADAPLGRWLADIGANLLCVVIVILLVLSRAPVDQSPERSGVQSADMSLPIYRAAPLSGAEGVTLLSRMALPGEPGRLLLDLRRDGVFIAGSDQPVDPAGLVAAAGDGGATLYLHDPAYHAQVRASADRAGMVLREITVPQALRDLDGSGWAPEYLAALDGVRSRAGFVAVLRRFLGAAAGRGPDNSPPPPPRRHALRDLVGLLQLGGNLACLALGGLGLAVIYRRGRRGQIGRR